MLTLVGFEIFRKPLKRSAIARIRRKPKPSSNFCNFGSARKMSLTTNIALSQTVAEFSAVVRTQYSY